MPDLDALRRDLDGIAVDTHPKRVQMKSRDFYWYSPVLKTALGQVSADLVATPRTEDETARILAACYRHDVPVTPRGAGTGNYGQAMPLAGGLVLDLSGLSTMSAPMHGQISAGPGAILHDIEKTARREGRELRMHPSTAETATIGGFVAGGSAGVGSIRWGALADAGNLLGVRLLTMEAEPRAIELSGPQINRAHHAYGTTGVITRIDLPLAPAPEWVDLLVGFDDWAGALGAGWQIAHEPGLLLRQLAVIEAPIPHDTFRRHRPLLDREQSLMVMMVARCSLEPAIGCLVRAGGTVRHRSDRPGVEGLPSAYTLCWNHTTLRALRTDPAITYLQTGYDGPDPVARAVAMSQRFGVEVPGHVEFRQSPAGIVMAGLPMVRFTTPERLAEIMAIHEAEGCPNYSPHVYTIEEGGMRTTDPEQLAFKRQVDPKGLLNPGKMIGWEDPAHDYARPYAYPGLRT